MKKLIKTRIHHDHVGLIPEMQDWFILGKKFKNLKNKFKNFKYILTD